MSKVFRVAFQRLIQRLDVAGGPVDADWADSVTITPP
jgi:hypothetical protein